MTARIESTDRPSTAPRADVRRGPRVVSDDAAVPEARPTFTVFTPTRDRGDVLHRVYESLKRQTYRDFEWLIIDNESSDATPEIVAGWQAEADFPIRYIRHRNRGVHVSRVRATAEARGELFLELRSADSCFPQALERFKRHWDAIPDAERDGFVGVTALAMDERGTLIGTRYPRDIVDSDPLETFYRYGVRGEKWGFQRTSVIRAHPLPEVEGYTGYMPEGIIWARIGRRYRTRYVNEILRVNWQDQKTSLSRPRRAADNAYGGVIETQEFLASDVHWFRYAPLAVYLRAAKYVRCSLHIGRGPSGQWEHLTNLWARGLWLAALPFGTAVYLLDRMGVGGTLDAIPYQKT
jgi:glycosyltransferase involved in cell wall biosynthesis